MLKIFIKNQPYMPSATVKCLDSSDIKFCIRRSSGSKGQNMCSFLFCLFCFCFVLNTHILILCNTTLRSTSHCIICINICQMLIQFEIFPGDELNKPMASVQILLLLYTIYNMYKYIVCY